MTDRCHAHFLCDRRRSGEERIPVRRLCVAGSDHDRYLRKSRSHLVSTHSPDLHCQSDSIELHFLIFPSASRLSTDLHADRHARAHQINSREYQIETAGRMSNLASGLTLFIAAWPVQAFFLIFIAATGWTAIPGGLLVWFIGSYALTVSIGGRSIKDHPIDRFSP